MSRISVVKSQRGDCLKLIFTTKERGNDQLGTETFNINNLAEVRFKFAPDSYYIAWKKHESVIEAFTVEMNILCESEQPFPRRVLCYQNWVDWVKIASFEEHYTEVIQPLGYLSLNSKRNYKEYNALEVSMCISKVEKITFPKLYEDDEFCDFNLNTSDDSGSVPVHKACLIAHSNTLKRMLSNEWKETINGCIKIRQEGVTLPTLQQLKQYLYLGTLPDDTVQMQPLLLIAKCYMIENLKTECIVKLAVTVKPEELHSLQEFAVDNKIPELIQAIVRITPAKTVQGAYQIEKDKELGPPDAKKSKCDENS